MIIEETMTFFLYLYPFFLASNANSIDRIAMMAAKYIIQEYWMRAPIP